MKLHVNRTCFHAGMKSQTGMSSFKYYAAHNIITFTRNCLQNNNVSIDPIRLLIDGIEYIRKVKQKKANENTPLEYEKIKKAN